MSSPKAFVAFAIATLPLVVLTCKAFFIGGNRESAIGDMPPVPTSVATVREKAGLILQLKANVDALAGADPAGFRGKTAGTAAGQPPFLIATKLSGADVAVGSADIKQVEQAIADLSDLTTVPDELTASVIERRSRLERHLAWLGNRRLTADTLAAAEKLLRDAVSVANAEACLKLVAELQRRLPKVAAAGEEPLDALTAEEAEQANALRAWSSCRRAFLQTKAKQASAGNASLKMLAGLVTDWDRFLEIHGRPGATDPDECIPEARQLRAAVHLQFLWQKASGQETAASFAPAVMAWLDASQRGREDDAGSIARANDLVSEWVDREVPKAPQVPAGLAGMGEGIVDDKQSGKRLIAIFQAVPGQSLRFRWWNSRDQQKELPLGIASGFLKAAPQPPKYESWAKRYDTLRAVFVHRGGFISDAEAFVQGSESLRDEVARHRSIPTYEPDDPFDGQTKGWADEIFGRAAEVAKEFVAALRDSGLDVRLTKNIQAASE
jgi:hypothetical protein